MSAQELPPSIQRMTQHPDFPHTPDDPDNTPRLVEYLYPLGAGRGAITLGTAAYTGQTLPKKDQLVELYGQLAAVSFLQVDTEWTAARRTQTTLLVYLRAMDART